jgi:aryl-alcohol dehydrogenase-like predicted oxidoreductase
VPIADSIGTLVELREEGKIRHIGVSNVTEGQLREMQKLTPVVSVQNRYNLGDRSSEAMVDLCDSESIVFLPWAPMQNIGGVPPVLNAARRLDVDPRQVALAWLLGRSPQILPIPGSGSPEHVAANVAATSLELTPDESNAILQLAQ